MKVLNVVRKLIAVTLVMCLSLSSVNWAEVIIDNQQLFDEDVSVNNQSDVDVDNDLIDNNDSFVSELVVENDIEGVDDDSPNEITDNIIDTNDVIDNNDSFVSELVADNDIEGDTDDLHIKITTDSIIDKNDDLVEGNSNTFGEYSDNDSRYYFVNYHFVLPENTHNDNGYQPKWTVYYDYEGAKRTKQLSYWVADTYDETASGAAYEPRFGNGRGVGILSTYATYQIVEGYDLIGWNTDEEEAKKGNKLYGISPAIEHPLTEINASTIDLYSVFEPIPVTIEFDINDSTKGTGSTKANVSSLNSQTVYIGDKLSFLADEEYTSKSITRDGYDLLGWSRHTYYSFYKHVNAEDSQKSDIFLYQPNDLFETSVLPSDWNGINKFIQPGMTMKLYAVWQPKVYKVNVHWPQYNSMREYTYEEALEVAREKESSEQYMIFDNDLEAMQSYNTEKGKLNPLTRITSSGVPMAYFVGIGDDPNCTDKSKVRINKDSYWSYIPEDGEVLELYFILTTDLYDDTINIKVDLDGGEHRMWTTFVVRQPIGSSYKDIFYNSLLSNLVKPGYVLDGILKINEDGSETDFDINRIATIDDKSGSSKETLKEYDDKIKEIQPIIDAYYQMKKDASAHYDAARNDERGYDVVVNTPEFKEFVDECNEIQKKYQEAIASLPNLAKVFDLYLKCKWKGKTIKGIFEYSGNRNLANRVTSQNMTFKMVTYGEPIGELPSPQAKGYKLMGWKTGRGLGGQYAWKDVDENTVFDHAEIYEPSITQLNYDEKEFTFYPVWEPITLQLNVEENEYKNADVVINNEFKFGESTVLDIHGEYTIKAQDTFNSSESVFGTGTEKTMEVYGIEVLDDYWTNINSNGNHIQVAGTKYNNGDLVKLYMDEGNALRIRPLWKEKDSTNGSGGDTSTENDDNKPSSSDDNKPSSSDDNKPTNSDNASTTTTTTQSHSGDNYSGGTGGSVTASSVLSNKNNNNMSKSSSIDNYKINSSVIKNVSFVLDTSTNKLKVNNQSIKSGFYNLDTGTGIGLYCIDDNGDMKTGLVEYKGDLYYMDERRENLGKMFVGEVLLNGYKFVFDQFGKCVSGKDNYQKVIEVKQQTQQQTLNPTNPNLLQNVQQSVSSFVSQFRPSVLFQNLFNTKLVQ